jgi:hypothetical protein
MLQHGSNVKALTTSRGEASAASAAVLLPFQQLRSLTKLCATNADLFDLPLAGGQSAATSSSSSSSSSSGGSGNSLTALTNLVELGLSGSSVFAVPGALPYLPALGASLTRLQLAWLSSRCAGEQTNHHHHVTN